MKSKGDYNDFVWHLGQRESGNRYDNVNIYGYVGRWQFGRARLYDLGISLNGWHPKGRPTKEFVTVEEFCNSTQLQDILMLKHVGQIARQVKHRLTKKYLEPPVWIHGVQLSLSGCVAGIHLKGWGGLYKWLKDKKDNCDGFGTYISEYVELFGHYDIAGYVHDYHVKNNNVVYLSALDTITIKGKRNED